MKTTLVLYEFPKAKQDVLDWARKKELKLTKTLCRWDFEINGNEFIILPLSSLTYSSKDIKCSKLVMFGSVTKADLQKITRCIKFVNP